MDRASEILQLRSLSVGYKSAAASKVILGNINASLRKGEMVALLGPNGVGKSTLLRTIAGLNQKLAGRIELYENDLESYSVTEMAKIAAFVFAGGLNIPNMSVYELVSLGRFPHTNWIGTIRKKDTEIIEDAINCVGLTRYRNTNVGELSDGERQRAMIARALAQDTDLLILDEPTAFLDLPNRFELIHLLKNLIRHKGKSVILSSHDLDISIREADKLWLALEDGLKQGSPEDLVIEGVLGSVFRESQIEFDENDGVFKYPVTTRMNIRLEGSGLERYWTERALNRIGIKANAESVSPSITVKYEGKFRWLYESAATRQEFYTVYDFIVYMKSVLSQS